MKNIIVQKALCLLLCCCSMGTVFSQSPPPPVDICDTYHPNQLMIRIDKTPPVGNKITGVAAFTRLGGVSVQSFGGAANRDVHLVEFDFGARDKYFNDIEDAHDFYECGGGFIQSVSGVKKVKVNGSDFNYDLAVNASSIPHTVYDLQNYAPYNNCRETYTPLPTIAACNNLTIATLDSGCETQTPFSNQVLFNQGYDFVDDDPLAVDLNGHGTRVMSVIAGATNNNATNIDYIPIRVLDEYGEGDLWTFFKGLSYGIEHADIIVASLEALICDRDRCTSVFEALLAKADQQNCLVVAAAGNTGALIDPGENYCIPASGQANNLISVGGSSCFSGPADFSNYGPINVDIFAPSEHISTYPPSLGTGTSYAAPQIAAVAAIAGLTNSEFNAANVKTFVLNNVINRNWGAQCVTGGTFDYNAEFPNCGASRRNGAEEELVQPDFSLNPYFSADNLMLSIDAPAEQKAKLQLINLSGAALAEEDLLLAAGKNEHQINSAQLPLGIYLVSLRTDTGKHLFKKVIKHY